MRKLIALICGLALAALSCYSISTPAPTAIPGIVNTIVVQTAQAASTATALAAPPTATATAVAACVDSATLLQEVTTEDSLSVPSGSKFATTWQLHNTGDCPWHGYSIAFVSGDRLGAPDSILVPDTASKSSVNVLIDLTAPSAAGSFTALFELRDAAGKALQLGSAMTFPVSVTVALLATATPLPEVLPTPMGGFVLPVPPAGCGYVKSASYPDEVIALINKARAGAGLPVLKANPLLTKSAQAHSTDMACNNYLSHDGRDHSNIHDRVVAAGYTPRFSEEMIFCGGYPADAFKWWMEDPPHHDVIFDKRVTEVGAGYAYLKQTQCGSYYTVDFGMQ